MNIMEQGLNSIEVLNGWNGMNVLPEIEENPENVWMLIKYTDHGDEFVVVGTRDGKKYQYGLYVTRKYSEFNDYLREPVLFKKLDDYAEVSNKIFFRFEQSFKESHMSFGYDKKCYSKGHAQFVFDDALKFISSLIESSDTVIDYDDHKNDIMHWLELNDIATEENIKKLIETKFTNKIGDNKIIGISGKMDISDYDGIVCDDVEFIYINKKKINPEKVTTYYGSDEWGCDSIYLSFKGFRQSKVRA